MGTPRVGRIKVNGLRCVGSARCRVAAPHTFRLVEDQAQVFNPQGDPIDRILQAARQCPTGAIAVFDQDGQPLFIVEE